MATINKKTKSDLVTHEGAQAKRINLEQQLRRSVMSCMLWENSFYESGEDISDRIKALVHKNEPETVAKIAIEARTNMKLRHVPLLLVRELARHADKSIIVADTLSEIIQRPDELTEFLAIYWKDGRDKLSSQVKKGLAKAFPKFSAYQLAKYNRDGDVKLRDVLFLCHAKPKDEEQAEVWKKLIDGKLESPDTWEVALSSGKDKKETWERLLSEKKLGGLALLRNLRNMISVNVSEDLIKKSLSEIDVSRILPFRFISASRYAPQFETDLERAMIKACEGIEKLDGKTAIVIDHSYSMDARISEKSDLSRLDSASALAILIREICDNCLLIGFSYEANILPSRRGMALRDLINSQNMSGTYTDTALSLAEREGYERIIVITDEQSNQNIRNPLPNSKAYFINVDTYKNGIGYGNWVHIDGWSESVINFIQEYEKK